MSQGGTSARQETVDAHLLLSRCTFPPPATEYVCAVSGGADSLALMVLAVMAGCRVTAVHVDHGLRTGSSAEAQVVAEAAGRYGAAFRSETVQVDDGPNLEARARAARRAVLPSGCATGHTMDDQAETVLINMLRGAGLDGLAAMRPGAEHPILSLRRAETRALCASEGLVPVEDPSNNERRFVRNRIRHELLPLCCEIAGRDVVPLLARQAELLAGDAEVLDELAARMDPCDGRALAAMPTALARRVARRWLRGGGYPPDLDAVERVLEVATGKMRAADVAPARRVRRSRGRLELSDVQRVRSGEATKTGPVVSAAREAARQPGNPLSSDPWDSDPDLGETVVAEDVLQKRVLELGEELTADYDGRPPLLVGVLKGAFVFMSDLARAIRLPVEVDVMAVSSYGSATTTSGVVRIVKDLDSDLTDRHVLVVEDIVDSGLTLSYLRKSLLARAPASLEVCALLVKEGRQRAKLDLKYVGFEIPPRFVVGYGLDVAQRYRNLPDIRVYQGPIPVD